LIAVDFWAGLWFVQCPVPSDLHHGLTAKKTKFLTCGRASLALLGAVFAALDMTGCGYAFRNSRSEYLEREGVRTVYLRPLTNNTFKPGIENIVYNALIRTLISHRSVKVVQNEKDADAVLLGYVTTAQFAVAAPTSAKELSPHLPNPLPPSNVDLTNTSVASVYSASLACNFSLIRRAPVPGKATTLWNGAPSRSKPFAAANQLDVPGTTSALINESEFERALGEMATSMADDVHESMLAAF
jgi:hypothetical protein